MKKNILIYGLIGGLVVSVPMLFMAGSMGDSEGQFDFEGGMLIGYASMLLAFSLVFVGIRNYRNKYNNGVISFGKAFLIGILIVLVASTVYVISWQITYFYFMPDFAEHYAVHMLDQLKASGASQAEIDVQVKEMAHFAELYKNPFFNAAITYMEILPVGLLVTLVSAAILRRKEPRQPIATQEI